MSCDRLLMFGFEDLCTHSIATLPMAIMIAQKSLLPIALVLYQVHWCLAEAWNLALACTPASHACIGWHPGVDLLCLHCHVDAACK